MPTRKIKQDKKDTVCQGRDWHFMLDDQRRLADRRHLKVREYVGAVGPDGSGTEQLLGQEQ